MKNLNNIFEDIKTPDSWKEILYTKAYAKKKSTPVFKRIAVGAGIAVAVTGTTATVGALTGAFNVADIIKNGFGDEVTASKIDSGEYQQLDASVVYENVTFKAVAFVGDTESSYTLVEAKLSEELSAQDISEISIEAVVLGEEIDGSKVGGHNLGDYGTDTYVGTQALNENGETVYYFQIKNYVSWVNQALIDGSDLNLWITNISLTDSEGNKTNKEIKEYTSYKPEVGTLNEINKMYFNKTMEVNGAKVALTTITPSDYQTLVSFEYFVPMNDTNEYRQYGEQVAYKFLDFAGEENYLFTGEKLDENYDGSLKAVDSNVKLYVNGTQLEFTPVIRPYQLMQSYGEGVEGNCFRIQVSFEPVATEDLDNIVLEVTDANGNVTKINGTDAIDTTEVEFPEASVDPIIKDEPVETPVEPEDDINTVNPEYLVHSSIVTEVAGESLTVIGATVNETNSLIGIKFDIDDEVKGDLFEAWSSADTFARSFIADNLLTVVVDGAGYVIPSDTTEPITNITWHEENGADYAMMELPFEKLDLANAQSIEFVIENEAGATTITIR